MNNPADPPLTCASVYLLTSAMECYSCKQQTRVHAFMALPPFQYDDDDYLDIDDDGSMLREIGWMSRELEKTALEVSGGHWRPDRSATLGATYWMNHCEHCGAKQGAHFVHGVEGAFWPVTDEARDAIQVLHIEGPHVFRDVGSGYSGAMADWRDRKHGVVREPPPVSRRRKPKAV